jgi:hypothetical protein
MDRRGRLLWSLGLLTLGVALGVCLLPAIPQDPAYHRFVDGRSVFGIPNVLNVVSNLPMVVIGLLGLCCLGRRRCAVFADRGERLAYAVFFLGTSLIGCGSAWYHLAPDNERLFWDRLPMAVTFMAFSSAMLAERVSVACGRHLLFPLLALGIASVVWWRLSEQAGSGDLRLYGFVHFYPAVLIPLLLWLFPARYSRGGEVWGALFFFILAIVCELLDRAIFAFGAVVSGHTLKHFFAAVAVWWVLRMLTQRRLADG